MESVWRNLLQKIGSKPCLKVSNLGVLQTSVTKDLQPQQEERALQLSELSLHLRWTSKGLGGGSSSSCSPRFIVGLNSRSIMNQHPCWSLKDPPPEKETLSGGARYSLSWLLGKGHSYYDIHNLALALLQKMDGKTNV